jgi:hypothetical protein
MPSPYLGQIIMFGGNFGIQGWAECDGQLLQIGLILTVSVFAAFMFQITRAIATVRMEDLHRSMASFSCAVMPSLSSFFRLHCAYR